MCAIILELGGIPKLRESSPNLLTLASMIPQRSEPTMLKEKGMKYGFIQAKST